MPQPTRECYTCKLILPASAYYKGNITKYYRCKECEKKRLAEYRKKIKDGQKHVQDWHPESIVCHGCLKVTPPKDIATTGKFAQSICISCFHKIKYHKRPHKAELINGKGVCTRCHMYGQSNNCIRPHQVDLDESDDNDF